MEIIKDILYNLYWNDNLTLKEIAHKYNCSLSVVWRRMKEYNIKTRPRDENNPMYGRKHSKNTKEKISEARKGQHNSTKTEFKKGQVSWRKGKRDLKMSERQKGKNNWMYGKTGIDHPFYGKHHSQETKKKMSLIKKDYIPWNKGRRCSQLDGENNPNWKGGISSEIDKIRYSSEMKTWRKKVYIRDNYTCQKCKIRGGRLCSHHIENFSSVEELRFDIDNGIILCKEHHNQFHKIYGRKNNNQDQINEFLIINSPATICGERLNITLKED